ncbi:hypothetical protein [Leptospira mayottensis]|uniref:Cold-shock DNA-binding domain protein n=2 Tax=Leptospira mayottensis TaxID=1137606 RepID=A0AA87MKX4_9LEPT|nr:hypothetical protein [Leptospira mayottensis]AXR66580.1 cold shock domain-containing protein [Leptospira mayottensis]AZQ04216.1 cold-shock protein [Leptospira mayottensis 200901116]EKR98073.1 cold-shock DNA-binding domain protein [Leptospira mayottensis 200901122]TGN04305.1 cold shock domain-containing protein [Leptospira mayottensis]
METKNNLTGNVIRYIPWNRNVNKGGYGFIESNGREYFFNAKYSSIKNEDITIGLRVEFELRKGYDKKHQEFVTQATRLKRV